MARYAMVDATGLVVNVVEWNGNTQTWQPPPDMTMVEDVNGEAGPGFTYADGAFVPPDTSDPDAERNQNITSAPDTLFGGPTIAQVLGET
jgi:hypothetical protein